MLRIFRKAILLTLSVCLFLIVGLLARLFFRDLAKRRKIHAWMTSKTCSLALKIIGLTLKVKNPPDSQKSYLFVGNHMGFLDIFSVAAIHEVLFITSVEMQRTPGLGLVCDMAGCFYTERRGRQKLPQEIEKIRQALLQGHSIVLFPEGHSTDGSKVLPFKKSLISAAIGVVPVKPFVINYLKVNNETMSHKWRDHICWYGDESFINIILRIFSTKSILAEIEFLDELKFESEESRKEVAQKAEEEIRQRFVPIAYPDGETPKFGYLK